MGATIVGSEWGARERLTNHFGWAELGFSVPRSREVWAVHIDVMGSIALDLAQVISRELEAAGFDIFLATDGLEALQAHASQQPDLVVLDWMQPGLDGLEMLRCIQQTSAVPV